MSKNDPKLPDKVYYVWVNYGDNWTRHYRSNHPLVDFPTVKSFHETSYDARIMVGEVTWREYDPEVDG